MASTQQILFIFVLHGYLHRSYYIQLFSFLTIHKINFYNVLVAAIAVKDHLFILTTFEVLKSYPNLAYLKKSLSNDFRKIYFLNKRTAYLKVIRDNPLYCESSEEKDYCFNVPSKGICFNS